MGSVPGGETYDHACCGTRPKKKITVLLKVVILQPCFDRHLLKATCSALFCFFPKRHLGGLPRVQKRGISCPQRCQFVQREILRSVFLPDPHLLLNRCLASLGKELVFFF